MIVALVLTIVAGLSTLLGGLAVFLVKKEKPLWLHVAMGFSAGVMIFISFGELLPDSIVSLGYLPAIIAFFAGVVVIALIDFLIPHCYEEEHKCWIKGGKERFDLKRCGTFIAIGIAIHNFPEGIAVFFPR